MDSVSQFVLGAGVSTAILGPRLGPRKAAILGGVLGTLPDLDVFYPYADVVDSFILHRGPTHSLLVQAVVTPLFGELILRLFRSLRDSTPALRFRVYAAVYLTFATHALLDAMTVYGTRLFWPITNESFGLGSVFIIDPLYTIPLLAVTVWALFLRSWTRPFKQALIGSLILSTAYLGWSAVAQKIAISRAEMAIGGWQAGDHVMATPVPFNTVFWKVLVLRGDDYANLYVPLLGGADQVRAFAHPRNAAAFACAQDLNSIRRIETFADGLVRFERRGDALIIADLRMGLTPAYAFRYELGRVANGKAHPVPPKRIPALRQIKKDLAWLRAGLAGQGIVRPDEADAALPLPHPESFLPMRPQAC